MQRHALTRADLVRALGDIDDIVAAQLLSVGATLPELQVALQLLKEEPRDDVEPLPRSRRVADLLDALRELDAAGEAVEPEYLGTD